GSPDRRGAHAGFVALLAQGELRARARPTVTRQTAGPGLPAVAGRPRRVGQAASGAGPAAGGRRGDVAALPRRIPPAHGIRAGGLPRPRSGAAATGARRPMSSRLQQGVIIVPSALTLGNLFFGIWAIVSAARGQFTTAAWLIVFAGIADTLDGRVARVTRTGSRFGEELDSLVDAISFGVAPAFIIYHLFLADGTWSWLVAFYYVSSAVIRLARFNVEQAGHAKVAFHGLPSPSAGMTLATFYPFSQTTFFQQHLASWPWPVLIIVLMFLLGTLMMSHVLYPVLPKFGFRTVKGLATLALMVAAIVAALTAPA